MFDIHKKSPLLLRINIPQIFTIYDIQALRKLAEDLQENILRGVTLVYNRYSEEPACNLAQAEDFQENILGEAILVYSEQSVCNLTERRTLPLVFSGEIFENEQLQTAASDQSKVAACSIINFSQ